MDVTLWEATCRFSACMLSQVSKQVQIFFIVMQKSQIQQIFKTDLERPIIQNSNNHINSAHLVIHTSLLRVLLNVHKVSFFRTEPTAPSNTYEMIPRLCFNLRCRHHPWCSGKSLFCVFGFTHSVPSFIWNEITEQNRINSNPQLRGLKRNSTHILHTAPF